MEDVKEFVKEEILNYGLASFLITRRKRIKERAKKWYHGRRTRSTLKGIRRRRKRRRARRIEKRLREISLAGDILSRASSMAGRRRHGIRWRM